MLVDVLREVDSGRVAKEAIPDVLRAVGENQEMTVARAVHSLGLRSADRAEIIRIVDTVLAQNEGLVKERGVEAYSPMMGLVMKELRGRVDGAEVGEILRKKLVAIPFRE
jgi:glutamyl-tRNA(Gln) amidotransferase subunit E